MKSRNYWEPIHFVFFFFFGWSLFAAVFIRLFHHCSALYFNFRQETIRVGLVAFQISLPEWAWSQTAKGDYWHEYTEYAFFVSNWLHASVEHCSTYVKFLFWWVKWLNSQPHAFDNKRCSTLKTLVESRSNNHAMMDLVVTWFPNASSFIQDNHLLGSVMQYGSPKEALWAQPSNPVHWFQPQAQLAGKILWHTIFILGLFD